jgi:phage baseplate assembly protein V
MRFGIISEVQGSKARVKLAENLVSDFLPVMQVANSFKRKWTPIRVGEQCFILSNLGDVNAGAILRSCYFTKCLAPSIDPDTEITIYSDGTVISYNTKTKTFDAAFAGNVTINIEGAANITAGSVKVETQTASVTANIADIICPETSINGNVTVEGIVTATSVIGTTVTVGGSELKSEGGKFKIDRPVEVSGDVKANGGLVYDKFGAIRTSSTGGGN